MSVFKLQWRGESTLQALADRLAPALDRHLLKIEAKAKAELYPGHGKITGTLQRSIGTEPSRRDGRRLIGKVVTRGVPYARIIHRRYGYLAKGFEKAKPFQP
jgi:hypothetical protein